MGDNEGSEDSVHVIKAINGKICVPIPLANTLKCGYCNRGRGGKWSAANRLKKAKEHIALKHADDAAASWSFQCNRCSAALDTWDAEDIHSTLQCPIDSSAPTLSILTALNDSFIVHLLPSLSHHLATGRVLKEELQHLDTECRKFMAHIANLPNHTIEEFFYSDRRVGGMGMFKLTDDADIWTLGRTTQLLTSKDLTVRGIFSEQLRTTIRRGLGAEPSYVLPPETISAFLSGSSEGGMYRVRFAQRSVANLWTLARGAARRLGVRIDVSGDVLTRLVADDISVLPVKAIRGLRTVVRQRHTRKFLDAPHQGRVANGLALDSSSKDVARTLSCRTELGHEDWKLLHRARLDILPLRGYPWYAEGDKSCRRCCQGLEDGPHGLNNSREGLGLATSRHDTVLSLLHRLLTKKGLTVSINRAVPGQSLRPDVEL